MTAISPTANPPLARVDQNALRFNQAMIVVLTVLAFILGEDRGGPWIVLFTGISMAIGAALPGKGPFQLLYRKIVVPAGLMTPHPELEDPRAPRFAQAMGAVCLIVASLCLFAGWTVAGWALAWIVVALALVNLLFGFCTGCFLFLQINRLLQPGASR